jgi:hypothetical protein
LERGTGTWSDFLGGSAKTARRGRDGGCPPHPHISRRAELPHWAPASDSDAASPTTSTRRIQTGSFGRPSGRAPARYCVRSACFAGPAFSLAHTSRFHASVWAETKRDRMRHLRRTISHICSFARNAIERIDLDMRHKCLAAVSSRQRRLNPSHEFPMQPSHPDACVTSSRSATVKF